MTAWRFMAIGAVTVAAGWALALAAATRSDAWVIVAFAAVTGAIFSVARRPR